MVTLIIMGITDIMVEASILESIIDMHTIDIITSMTEDMLTVSYMVREATNTPNVHYYVGSTCTVPRHCEQNCHVAICQLATYFDVNILKQANDNTFTTQVVEQLQM